MQPQSPITFYSHLDSSGYSRASLDYLVALQGSEIPVFWRRIYWNEKEFLTGKDDTIRGDFRRARLQHGLSDKAYDRLEDLTQHQGNSSTSIFHCVPELWSMFGQVRTARVGMTVWETDRLPHHWKPLIQDADHIIIPGGFTKQAFDAAGITTPITIIPHVFRPASAGKAFHQPTFRCRFRIPEDHFVFYSINEWSSRKALWDTIGAYLLTFTERDTVTLVIKTSRFGTVSPRSLRQIEIHKLIAGISANFPRPAHIVVIGEKLTDEDIAGLHLAGDAYISLARGEGWGLGAFYAAAAGNPVIITGWGGQVDYLGKDYPFLLDFKMVPAVDKAGEPSFTSDQNWARADIDHAMSILRIVYQDLEKARGKVASLARKIPIDYSTTRIAAMFIPFL
jgi:glycosyltransferase involved in cell wall biosynthesis